MNIYILIGAWRAALETWALPPALRGSRHHRWRYGSREAGDDDIFGGDGKDTIDGGPDTDDCDGGPAADTATNCENETDIPRTFRGRWPFG